MLGIKTDKNTIYEEFTRFIEISCFKLFFNQSKHTGLPRKDETSETIVRNLNRLFPHINAIVKLCLSLTNNLISHLKTLYEQKDFT